VGFELSLKNSMPRVRTRFQVLELRALPDPEPVTQSAAEGTQSTKVSPKAPHTIAFERYFITGYGHILCLGLSNEDTVKWILVRARQKSGANTMFCRNGQELETFAFELATEFRHQVRGRR